MGLRKGIVVDVHPADHSVDVVLVDNYARLVGVQVQVHTASSRSGSIELPDVEVRKDKWNIAERTGQEVMALVDFVGRVPIVTGFLYPQISQMTHKDGKLKYHRHTSDVQTYTDGEGNMGLIHPCGAHIVIGKDANPKDFTGANFDKNAAIDRNKGNNVLIKVELSGKAVVLTMKPDGTVTLECDKLTVDATTSINMNTKNATIKASDSIVLDTPQTHITGQLTVDKATTMKADVGVTGTVTASVDVNGGGTSLHTHTHMGDGGDGTPGPTSPPQ